MVYKNNIYLVLIYLTKIFYIFYLVLSLFILNNLGSMSLILRKTCPFCNYIKFNTLYSLKYKSNKLRKFFKKYYHYNSFKLQEYCYDLIECKNCTGIFQKYIPNKNFSCALYNKIISTTNSLEKKLNFSNINFKKYFNECRLIEKIINKKPRDISVLEFGSGWGTWAKFLKANNFKVDCFEISRKRINYIKNDNITVLKSLNFTHKNYDFIYSDQTFEHLNEPKKTINTLSMLLKKNGYMLLGFPSSFLFKSKLNKNYIPCKDAAQPLEHINLFNKKCLKIMIEDSSLKIIHFKSVYDSSIKNILLDIKNYFIFNYVLLKKY